MAPPSNERTALAEIGKKKKTERKSRWWKQNEGKMRISTWCFMVLSSGRFLFSPSSVAAVTFLWSGEGISRGGSIRVVLLPEAADVQFSICVWMQGYATLLKRSKKKSATLELHRKPALGFTCLSKLQKGSSVLDFGGKYLASATDTCTFDLNCPDHQKFCFTFGWFNMIIRSHKHGAKIVGRSTFIKN